MIVNETEGRKKSSWIDWAYKQMIKVEKYEKTSSFIISGEAKLMQI